MRGITTSGMRFDEFPATMIVLIVSLKGEIIKHRMFGCLPVVNRILPSGDKVEFHSLRYRGYTRGSPGGFFKNTVIVEMKSRGMLVNFGVSSLKLRVSGTGFLENSYKAIFDILDEIKRIERILELITEELAGGIRAYFDEYLELVDRKWRIPDPKHVFTHQTSELDTILSYLFSFLHEYRAKEDFMKQLDWLLSKPKMFEGDLDVDRICPSIIKYNYNLGFKVSPFHLHESLENVETPFYIDYANMLNNFVKLSLPYAVENENMKRKKNVQCHVFKIHKSGEVSQQGPGGALSREAYISMLRLISKVYPELISPDL